MPYTYVGSPVLRTTVLAESLRFARAVYDVFPVVPERATTRRPDWDEDATPRVVFVVAARAVPVVPERATTPRAVDAPDADRAILAVVAARPVFVVLGVRATTLRVLAPVDFVRVRMFIGAFDVAGSVPGFS